MIDPDDERRGETVNATVPYAPVQFECGTAYVDCPMCGARIGLTARKDFESYSMSEYAAHVAATHPDRVVYQLPDDEPASTYAYAGDDTDERDGSSTSDEWNDPARSARAARVAAVANGKLASFAVEPERRYNYLTANDQPRSYRTAPDCARCKHPAVYHGRALPYCDAYACNCAGYARQGAHV